MFQPERLYAFTDAQSHLNCLNFCIVDKKCRSFNYIPQIRTCYFSTLSSVQAKNEIFTLPKPYRSLFYLLRCKHANSPPERTEPNDDWSGRPGVPVFAQNWRHHEKNIVNDVQVSRAVPHSHPWIVNLRLHSGRDSSRCSGVIVPRRGWTDQSDLVLTAAHCVCRENSAQIVDWQRLQVDVGTANVKIRSKHSILVNVKGISVHNSYVGQGWKGYDLALLKLAQSLKFNRYVAPIAILDDITPIFEHKSREPHCFMAGWQLTRKPGRGDTSKLGAMQQMPVTIHTGSYCKKRWTVDFDPRTMICSTNWENRHVGCDGDSGGPVACTLGNQTFLIGIVSYGIHERACRQMSRPSVSTKVARFLPWIEEQKLILDRL